MAEELVEQEGHLSTHFFVKGTPIAQLFFYEIVCNMLLICLHLNLVCLKGSFKFCLKMAFTIMDWIHYLLSWYCFHFLHNHKFVVCQRQGIKGRPGIIPLYWTQMDFCTANPKYYFNFHVCPSLCHLIILLYYNFAIP